MNETGDLPVTPPHAALLQPMLVVAGSPTGDVVDSFELVIRAVGMDRDQLEGVDRAPRLVVLFGLARHRGAL